ncbi:hypothetical protein L3Y34_019568 [Caenorhabditis briggsae]|uniref:MATH domain-containing protein n=1 Tax=Caenorhabditis briggsae TaxID=6238 RepID=A0AAE9DQ91_CAEBR|nr:hypothetical protein L3Y34_019568 [Caenorhabditis briggsae]
MAVIRNDYHLGLYLFCDPVAPGNDLSIQTKVALKIVRKNQNDAIKTVGYCYQQKIGYGIHEFLEWEKMEKECLVEGNLTVEAHVSIIQTTGLGKEKIRMFDEIRKHVSDVILIVRDTKFYVPKLVRKLFLVPSV